MKKHYLTFAAALFATATFAQAPRTPMFKTHANGLLQPTTELIQNGKFKQMTNMKGTPLDLKGAPIGSIKKAPKKNYPAIQGELITEQPAGTLKKDLYGTHTGYQYFYGYVFNTTTDGAANDVVFAEDGSVYIYNPLSTLRTNTWLKGTLGNNDTITVALPQPIYHQDASGNYAELTAYATKMNLEYTEDEGYWPVADSISPNMQFTYKDGVLEMVPNDGYTLLALCDETGAWYGYGDYYKQYTEENSPVSTPSESATYKEYILTSVLNDANPDSLITDQQLVRVYNDGNDIYLTDLIQKDDKVFVKGTLADGKLTITSGDYLGKPSKVNYHMYTKALGWKSVYDEYYATWEDSTYFIDKLDFDYDAKADTYTGENNYLTINYGRNTVYSAASFKKPVLSPYKEVIASPAKPTINTVADYIPEGYPYGYISVDLTTSSEDGTFLDPNRIYYNIYTDNDVLTLYADEYVYLEQYYGADEMTDIPFYYIDSYDIYASGKTRTVYIYVTGYDKIGIQEYYLASDNTKHYSETAWFDYAALAGIENATISDNGSKAASVAYYDLSGRQVSQPQHGIYVKTTKYADGTVKSAKTLIK